MQYPYLTLLEGIRLVLVLSVGVTAFYFLVRLFNKTIKFSTALKSILLYELGSFLIYLVYPFPLFNRIFQIPLLEILDFLIFIMILFLVFFFITRKNLLVTWKKSLGVFLITVFVLLPFLNFFMGMIAEKITANSPPFSGEYSEFQAQIEEWGTGRLLFFGPPPLPLPFKIISIVENSMFWPINYLRDIVLTFNY